MDKRVQYMENNLLPLLDNYLIDQDYVSGRIIEYDIQAANASILYAYDKISEEDFLYLLSLPKEVREVNIGKRIRENKEIYNIIHDGIISARKEFYLKNQVSPHEVIRIANDAIYINRFVDLNYLCFKRANSGIEFKKKNVYHSYLKLGKYLFFINYNPENPENINVDVKGISEKSVALHANYLLSEICNTVYIMERVSPVSAIEYISKLIADYINLQLPLEYYREFNSFSGYRSKSARCVTYTFGDNMKDLDINCNLILLRDLNRIVFDNYTKLTRGRRD